MKPGGYDAIYKNKCNCSSLCSTCNQLKGQCLCDIEFVNSLSAKIEKQFEEETDSYIPASDQVNISDIVEDKLDLMDIAPPDPGEKVDMGHCSVEQRKIIEDLMTEYEAAFAKSRYDVGSYTGFVASIDVTPHTSHIEKERPMKVDAKRCLRPIVDELVKNGILTIRGRG